MGKLFERWSLGGWAGNVPLPERGISGPAMTNWYLGLIAWYRDRVAHRDEPFPPDHADCADCRRRRHGFKCEAKDAEVRIQLVHAVLAPEAPFTCDEECAHVREGMPPDRVKAWLDHAKHSIKESEDYLWGPASRGRDTQWCRDELEEEEEQLRKFLARLEQPEYARQVIELKWELRR
jgi:hypothetical protein